MTASASTPRSGVLALAFAAVVALSCSAAAEETGYRKNVGAYLLYLTIMPAKVLEGPLLPEPAGDSLNRPVAAGDTPHVMVSVLEAPKQSTRAERKP